MRITLILTLLLLTSTALADDIRFTPGTSVAASVTLVADANGTLQIDRSKAITIGATPIVKPDLPIGETDRVRHFRESAAKIADNETAKKLAALYEGMAFKSRPPNPLYTTPAELEKSVRMGTDIFIIGATGDWTPFRDLLTDEWVVVAKRGGGMPEYSELLLDASTGLAETPGSKSEAFDLGAIFKVLEILSNKSTTFAQKVIAILPLLVTLFK